MGRVYVVNQWYAKDDHTTTSMLFLSRLCGKDNSQLQIFFKTMTKQILNDLFLLKLMCYLHYMGKMD